MSRVPYSAFILCLASFIHASAHTYTDYIDTRVGTAPSEAVSSAIFGKKTEVLGQTIPAVLQPNGMNFWTPQTRDTELKCIAPYYYLDDKLQGFRNSHWIIGGCTQDYGSMTMMPITGRLRCSPQARASSFSHADEVARPHYYSVRLPEEKLTAELTGTSRCAIMRLTYEEGGKAYLVVNPNNDEAQGFIAVDTTRNIIYGYNPVYRIYQGKGEAAGFDGHFIVQLDKKISGYGCFVDDTPLPGVKNIGKKNGIGCYVAFDVEPGERVMVKAASSFTGHEGALANMEAELPGWDFDSTKDALLKQWDSHLGVVEVESDDSEALSKFYGAMYRASFLPHEVNDVDGRYTPFASGYPVAKLPAGETRYFDGYSMWDTYRALHPLVNLLYPSMGGEMMQSLVHKYEQGGWLPIFPCWGSYTAAMIGDHCIAAIADAYIKGVDNFEIYKAYEAMRRNAFEVAPTEEYLDGKGRRALDSYLAYGYVPLEDSVPNAYHKQEQTSRTLEYCYDDFALAQVARKLGREADYKILSDRANNFVNVINPATGYADGRHADGRFSFDPPFEFSKHITEGAPCHYTWYVPHAPESLMEIMGGKKAYVAKLDSMFSENRYWHGNEPCHQIPFMYNYAGEMAKTTKAVRHIMETEYFNTPGGLSGNEDAGQMSAWYVFAALGFYPVCPATTQYAISGPTFKEVRIHLENGRLIVMRAHNLSDKNIYVKSIRHNGRKFREMFLTHEALLEGGLWEFEMTDKAM